MKKISFEESNYFIFRAVMGMNLLIHGSVRIFGDYSVFIEKMEQNFAGSILPKFLVSFSANLISPAELILGIFLLIGFKTRFTIVTLNLLMLMLVSGVCLLQKWNLAGMQMSYVLYLFFLGLHIKHNRISLDQLLQA